MDNIPIRKYPIFFYRNTHLKIIENKGEYAWVRDSLMLGLIRQTHAYIYREKKLRKREDVVEFFRSLFFPKNELGILKEIEFHQYKKEILQILELYD